MPWNMYFFYPKWTGLPSNSDCKESGAFILVVSDWKLFHVSAALCLWFRLPTWPSCMHCISDTDAVFGHSAVEPTAIPPPPPPIWVRFISRPNEIIRLGSVLLSATRGFPIKAGHNVVRRQQKRVRELEGDLRLQVAARHFYTSYLQNPRYPLVFRCETDCWLPMTRKMISLAALCRWNGSGAAHAGLLMSVLHVRPCESDRGGGVRRNLLLNEPTG